MKPDMLNFQPMPKRFMVWDDEATDWICVPGTERDIWDLVDLLTHKTGLMRHKFHMKIVQSTNLFDKDGKEIFEGSIVRGQVFDDSKTCIVGVVVYRQQTFWIVNAEETHSEPLLKFYEKEVKVVGHILSRPELLEEKE